MSSTTLERGSLGGASAGVLDAIARALQLDEAERAHSQRRVPPTLERPQRAHHGTGVKHFHHHVVGDLALAWESLDLRAEPGLTMTIYAAEPGSSTEHALALLASWAATSEPHARTGERAARRT